MVEKTGGVLVLSTESFTWKEFTESFPRVFSKAPNGDLEMTFSGDMRVLTSK